MAYIYNLADTWNAGATVFTAIKMNVTDTASAAGSLLMDLQVGAASRFSVRKDGVVTLGGSAGFAKQVASDYLEASTGWSVAAGSGGGASMAPFVGFVAGPSCGFSFGNANGVGAVDLTLRRDAANTLAQRNGVNAQAFNLYNTYTDASNYERGFMRWSGNQLQIGVEGAGTGLARAMRIDMGVSGILTTRYLNNANNSLTMFDLLADGTGTATYALGGSAPLLRFGGTTSSFPAIKRSTTSLQARLADDSAFANIQGKLTTDTAYTGGAPTATGYIVLFDSTGAAYRVPAVAN